MVCCGRVDLPPFAAIFARSKSRTRLGAPCRSDRCLPRSSPAIRKRAPLRDTGASSSVGAPDHVLFRCKRLARARTHRDGGCSRGGCSPGRYTDSPRYALPGRACDGRGALLYGGLAWKVSAGLRRTLEEDRAFALDVGGAQSARRRAPSVLPPPQARGGGAPCVSAPERGVWEWACASAHRWAGQLVRKDGATPSAFEWGGTRCGGARCPAARSRWSGGGVSSFISPGVVTDGRRSRSSDPSGQTSVMSPATVRLGRGMPSPALCLLRRGVRRIGPARHCPSRPRAHAGEQRSVV